jgi:tetratricopeptide (TPR) repeat protein
MHHSKLQQYPEAIRDFQSSYSFFSRNSWVDRHRSITIMSPSAISYREMALVNIAFSYSQLSQGTNAKEYYRRALDEFPNSIMARAALRLIESVENPDRA